MCTMIPRKGPLSIFLDSTQKFKVCPKAVLYLNAKSRCPYHDCFCVIDSLKWYRYVCLSLHVHYVLLCFALLVGTSSAASSERDII